MKVSFEMFILLLVCFTTFSQNINLNQQLPIIIDKEKNYPKKSFKLDDVAEVSYIPLETNKDVLMDNDRQLAYISDKRIVVFNYKRGDVLIFDINGKALSHFNGGAYIGSVVYDDNNNEVIVFERLSQKITVYTEKGVFKRFLRYPDHIQLQKICNFDDQTLLIYHERLTTNSLHINSISPIKPYMLISKKDGQVVSNLNITMDRLLSKNLYWDTGVNKGDGFTLYVSGITDYSKFGDEFFIANRSLDTVYLIKRDKKQKSMFVQHPTVFSEHPRIAFVTMKTDQYIFFSIMPWDMNEAKVAHKKGQRYTPSFKEKTLMYEFQTGNFFEYTGKPLSVENCDVPKNTSAKLIDAHYLVRMNNKGLLQGSLKKIASTLDEEDNAIVELIKFK